ncbi:MAG: thioredoxin [Cyclobacteriaceae bacterium]
MKKSFSELVKGSDPVLVDFHAEWCGPCKMMAPILTELSKELQGKVKIIKVDVDKNPNAAAAYQVQGVPTLILFKEGKTVWRQSGVVPAHQLRSVINQNLPK